MALHKEIKEKIVKEFGKSANDTGSVEVQVALLTEEIRGLTEHCQKFPKDMSTRHGLRKKVCRRSRFLSYLAKNESDLYNKVVSRLELKK
jgi:small subunit ribosomal protein S15